MLDLEDAILSKDISSLRGAIQRSEAFRGHHHLDSSLVEEARFQLELQSEIHRAVELCSLSTSEQGGASRFFLVRANYILGLRGRTEEREGRPLPEFRDIFFQGGMVNADLNLETLMKNPLNHRHIAIVSHRWLKPGHVSHDVRAT